MKTRWYKDAVVYQIYPRSFLDSNGDGVLYLYPKVGETMDFREFIEERFIKRN